MDNYEYLTENEKSIFGYIENIPSEYEPIEEVWNEEDLLELDALNDIFNLQNVSRETLKNGRL